MAKKISEDVEKSLNELNDKFLSFKLIEEDETLKKFEEKLKSIHFYGKIDNVNCEYFIEDIGNRRIIMNRKFKEEMDNEIIKELKENWGKDEVLKKSVNDALNKVTERELEKILIDRKVK